MFNFDSLYENLKHSKTSYITKYKVSIEILFKMQESKDYRSAEQFRRMKIYHRINYIVRYQCYIP